MCLWCAVISLHMLMCSYHFCAVIPVLYGMVSAKIHYMYIVYMYIVLLAFQFPEKGEASVVKVYSYSMSPL